MTSNREKRERRMSGTALQTILSLVSLLLGVLLTFVPGVSIRTLCYVFCSMLVAAGVAAIVYFFLSGAYRRLDDYNFALGVMLLVLGCCGFARIGGLEGRFAFYLGLLTLVLGIIILQNTVQLRVTGSSLWICPLIFTAAALFGAVTIILDIRPVWDAVQYWILIVSGVLALVSLVMTAMILRRHAKQEKKAAEAPAETPHKEAVSAEAPQQPEPEAALGNLWPHDPLPDTSGGSEPPAPEN